MVGRPKRGVAATVAVAIAIALVATPAVAAGGTLFADALTQPSSAIQPSTGMGYATSFEGGHFVMNEMDPNSSLTVAPQFQASAQQLSRVAITVTAAVDNAHADVGVVCRRHSDVGTEYALLMSAVGTPGWILVKHEPSTSDKLGDGFKGLKPNKPNRIGLACVGPTTPSPNGAVRLTVFINGKKVFSASDGGAHSKTPALAAGVVGLRVAVYSGKGTFSNLNITEQ